MTIGSAAAAGTGGSRRCGAEVGGRLRSLRSLRLLLVAALFVVAAVTSAGGATSALAAPACANEQLREESKINPSTGQPYSVGLPDCRAYEMVSPLEKQGHDAGFAGPSGELSLPVAVAPNGETAGWGAEGAFAETENYSVSEYTANNKYLSRRGGSGWITSSAFAPRSLVDAPFTGGLDGDLSFDMRSKQVSCGVNPPAKGERGGGSNVVCALRSAGGKWESSSLFHTASGAAISSSLGYLGGSSDLSRVFVQPNQRLKLKGGEEDKTPEKASAGIYEIAGLGSASQTLRLVNVDNSGNELLLNEAGTLRGPLFGAARENPNVRGSDYHALSESGNTVFFTATPPASEVLTLYARVRCAVPSTACKDEGNGEDFETVPISAPSKSDGTTPCEVETAQNATFQGASADGSKVFFTTKQRLLSKEPSEEESTNLYEYDFSRPECKKLVLLSEVLEPVTERANVTGAAGGVVRTASDGSHIYFVSRGVLTTAANLYKEKADDQCKPKLEPCKPFKLYAYDTITQQLKFVAAASSAQEFDIEDHIQDSGLEIDNNDVNRHAQTTPNGRFLVFSSPARITASTPATPEFENKSEFVNKSGNKVVYRYDFETGELMWISHGAPGFTPPTGSGSDALVAARPSGLLIAQGSFASMEDWTRAISGLKVGESNGEYVDEHDGEYIVFTTSQPLQAGDENKSRDVYAWHCASPCANPAAQGEVHLISDGHDPAGVENGKAEASEAGATMSATGSDIFFFSRTTLVGQDRDVLRDLYDARIGGGFPRPAAEPSCSGEECQGRASEFPSFGRTPSSLAAAGGNLVHTISVRAAAETKPKPKAKALTRAQLRAKALRACKAKPRKKRATCEAQAKKRYRG